MFHSLMDTKLLLTSFFSLLASIFMFRFHFLFRTFAKLDHFLPEKA